MREAVNNYVKEATVITKYLVGKKAAEPEIRKYEEAMQLMDIRLTPSESKTWKFMVKNSWAFGALDGALAIRNPHSEIRRKIFIMLAILETSPDYAALFLPRRFSLFYFFKIAFVSVRAVARMIIGNILLLLI